MAWTDLIAAETLERKGKVVVRHEGRQILVMRTERGLYALANRCPHQGYPLSEGVVTDGCILTCNWHNWKFDLASGETLVGGDRLRRFPVRIAAGRVEADLSPEAPSEVRARVLSGVAGALEDEDGERLVRETARLAALGDDPARAVAFAVDWAAPRLEFGTTHAIAAAPDWLALHDSRATRSDEKLAAIGEILAHLAEDGRKPGPFPFPPGEAPWCEAAFLAAVEAEDEPRALALVRGGLAAGMAAADFLPALCRAALAHYADFGHSLIYSVKTVALAQRLGPESSAALLLLLTRSLIYARREDLLPEFRDYRGHLEAWGRPARTPPPPAAGAALIGLSARKAMALVRAWSAGHPPVAIFEALIDAAGWELLHVDDTALFATDAKIADSVGWLDFTHAVTFADAGRTAVAAAPELWPAVLLQLACFIGRNAAYMDPGFDTAPFAVANCEAFFAAEKPRLLDHGHAGFIYSCHLIKTLMAARSLARAHPAAAPGLLAGVHRFLHAPPKRRHILRTARQMRAFVAQE